MYKLAFFYLLTIPLCGATLDSEEAALIGKQIFFNECSEKREKLLWWNQGEEFASLGIGHFIWYPEGERGPFEETFPQLLDFFNKNQVTLPPWLQTNNPCPWNTREQFFDSSSLPKKMQLQELLLSTLSLQTQFIYQRFETALEKIVASLDEKKKVAVIKNLERLQSSTKGKFALIDYVNFKGEGISEQEHYQGFRWGLKQVLESMSPDSNNPLNSFTDTAKKLLTQRVEKAPPERHEERWLPGWLARIDRYR